MASPSSKSKSSNISPAKPADVEAAPDDDRQSLDFTDFFDTSSPPPQAAAKPKLELALEPVSSAETSSVASTPADLPVEPQPEIEILPFPLVALDSLIEKTALLFASGKAGEARKTLENVVQSGQASEETWPLLFDLYRLSGEQVLFDQLAIDFAQHFEKSPPTWHAENEAQVATTQDGRASVSLTGILNARCAPQFAKLAEVAKTRASLRLDMGKIQDVDQGGCQLLLDILRQLKKSTCELTLASVDHLIGLMKPRVISGKPENDAVWLLLLEIYQRLGQQQLFDDLALEYAITFEVSPPSWEAPKTTTTDALDADSEATDVVLDFEHRVDTTLTGEILMADASHFANVAQVLPIPGDDDIIIDSSNLKRIDQQSVVALHALLKARPSSDRRIRLTNCSHLVAAMFDMAGIGQIAQVERQKF